MPSEDEDLLLVKPLGGTEEEITGVYLPLAFKEDLPLKTRFPKPTEEDIGDFFSAKLLYNACRLSFRNAAGPFRSIGKYSFRPRAYQIVPMIMSLRQEFPVRLLIADDVGIGKTIESLMIVRELMDRGHIKRFAIVCLPHLCEQWQLELRDKFGIEAEIIRSSTAAKLDRRIQGDESVFHYYPYQVISVDYIKSDQRSQTFIHECPELVIVDEAHTCARPKGASLAQMQRHHLIHQIAQKEGQHLILCTATPHSGKPEEFQSLLGLLDPTFEAIGLEQADEKARSNIAQHFVQRRRKDIEKWVSKRYAEDTTFPERESFEVPYELSNEYKLLFDEVLQFARGLVVEEATNHRRQRMQYWTALGLLRGIMSSPRMGVAMLETRAAKALASEEADWAGRPNPVIDSDYGQEGDNAPLDLMESVELSDTEWGQLKRMAEKLSSFENGEKDGKLLEAAKLLAQWLKEGFNPIIFCRYINTAEYVGEALKGIFGSKRNIGVEVVTSNDPDELRKEKVDAMERYKQRILVATDCMSEGINLQRLFTAVIHYDLPWNPNRLEQREGRVDRFGQRSKKVKVGLLYGKDNPIDGVVLKVLLRKAIAIKRSIGISVPFPEDNQSIMDAVGKAILLKPQAAKDYVQLNLFGDQSEFKEAEQQVERAYKRAEEREKATRSIFAQHAINAQDIETDLQMIDEAIGNVAAVESFVQDAVAFLGGEAKPFREGYKLFNANLPFALQSFFGDGQDHIVISFDSPTPEGYRYIGRNHPLVEQLCQVVLNDAVDGDGEQRVARVSVIRTDRVKERTTVLELRVRNVISNLRGTQELVAEEMILRGYRGLPRDGDWIEDAEVLKELLNAIPIGEVAASEKRDLLLDALEDLDDNGPWKEISERIGRRRSEKLIEAHERARAGLGSGHNFKVVEPILPLDVMGIYILLPGLD